MLKAAYKNASDKKTFVWTLDEWRAKCGKVLASKDIDGTLLDSAHRLPSANREAVQFAGEKRLADSRLTRECTRAVLHET